MTYTAATPATATFDLRELAPRERNARVFSRFDALQPGEAMQLLIDHDAQTLRAEFASRRAAQFEWDVMDAGPSTWRVQGAPPVVGTAFCSSAAEWSRRRANAQMINAKRSSNLRRTPRPANRKTSGIRQTPRRWSRFRGTSKTSRSRVWIPMIAGARHAKVGAAVALGGGAPDCILQVQTLRGNVGDCRLQSRGRRTSQPRTGP